MEHGYKPEESTVFAIAAEAPHSATNHVSNDPEGILDTICSVMSTIGSNTAVLGGHMAVALGLEHAKTIAQHGWTRADIRNYIFMNHGNRFIDLAYGHRYGKVYNRNIPKWYKREDNTRIPVIHSPDNIHLFVMGGTAGRFSAVIPGWGHMSTPVHRPIDLSVTPAGPDCASGTCAL